MPRIALPQGVLLLDSFVVIVEPSAAVSVIVA